MFMQHMAREKIIMQEKIVVLKQELQELHVDVDLSSFLKSIQETDNHSQSTATGQNVSVAISLVIAMWHKKSLLHYIVIM